jgi:glyoxylase-like metal-dependent hydrolase (beta-lactamase superfamily II)
MAAGAVVHHPTSSSKPDARRRQRPVWSPRKDETMPFSSQTQWRIAKRALPALFAAATVALGSAAASPYSDINAAAAKGPINVHPLRGHLSMLDGSGGNITVLTGPDGFVLVDCGIAVSRAMIVKALRGVAPGKIHLAILTHWHWDHADGDAWVRQTGASIIADRQAMKDLQSTIRVEEWEHTFTPIPRAALPNIVITGDKTVHANGETIRIRRYAPGHTDSDISVYFTKANVLSTGDTFWNGQYPFIDYASGGGIDGAIRAADANIAMSTRHTIIIPGHGPVGDRASQIAFRDMLVAIRGKIAAMKAKGMTVEQVVAAKPTATFDAKWGRSVISGPLFTRLVYRGV